MALAVPGTSCQDSLESIDAGASSLWLKCWCPLLQGQWSLPPGIKEKSSLWKQVGIIYYRFSFNHNYKVFSLLFLSEAYL